MKFEKINSHDLGTNLMKREKQLNHEDGEPLAKCRSTKVEVVQLNQL